MLLAAAVAILLVGVAVTAICIYFRPSLRDILHNMGLEGSDAPGLIQLVRKYSTKMADDNRLLRDVVQHTSDDVIKSMFLGLIMGQSYDPQDIDRTLSYTGLGFESHDVYAVGVAKAALLVSTEQRINILDAIDEAFSSFRRKYECHTFAFPSDTSKIAIIVSYPPSRSIADGKIMTTELSRILLESLQSTGIELSLHFGHLYHSILDIGFSYSEADRATDSRLGTVSPVILETAADQNENDDTDTEDLDRRATQIAQFIYKERRDEAVSLTGRVISGIFAAGDYDVQCRNAKYFISELIENIVSYDFINRSQLSNVTADIYTAIESKADAETLEKLLHDATVKLCDDFSSILKKQRNPYIKATLDYISRNYANPDLSLIEIADTLGVAPNYLSNLFSKNTGVKLFDYINDYRIKKAKELLTTTNQTVQEISIKSGFSTPRNFIRVFKKVMDITPGAYRKQVSGIT